MYLNLPKLGITLGTYVEVDRQRGITRSQGESPVYVDYSSLCAPTYALRMQIIVGIFYVALRLSPGCPSYSYSYRYLSTYLSVGTNLT